MRNLIILFGCLLGLASKAPAAHAGNQEANTHDLLRIVDSKRAVLDVPTLSGQFSSLCNIHGGDALSKALIPFADFDLSYRTMQLETGTPVIGAGFRLTMARYFERGFCVPQNTAIAEDFAKNAAFEIGPEIVSLARRQIPQVSDFHAQAEKLIRLEPTSYQDVIYDTEDYFLARFDLYDSPPPWWGDQLQTLTSATDGLPAPLPPLTPDETTDRTNQFAARAMHLDREQSLGPLGKELDRIQQIIDLGLDGPRRTAHTLRFGQTGLPNANILANAWLMLALDLPFSDPYAFHTAALWYRDPDFFQAREREGEAIFERDELTEGNKILAHVVEMGDTSLLPLAYCLMESRSFEKTPEIQKLHNKALYSTLLWMKENGQAYPEHRLAALEDTLSTGDRAKARLAARTGNVTIRAYMLPTSFVDLTACAEATGQKADWQRAGILKTKAAKADEASEKTGEEAAQDNASGLTDGHLPLKPLDDLFDRVTGEVDWVILMASLTKYCEANDRMTMDRYLAPLKDPIAFEKSFERSSLWDLEKLKPGIRRVLADIYQTGICVPEDKEFANSFYSTAATDWGGPAFFSLMPKTNFILLRVGEMGGQTYVLPDHAARLERLKQAPLHPVPARIPDTTDISLTAAFGGDSFDSLFHDSETIPELLKEARLLAAYAELDWDGAIAIAASLKTGLLDRPNPEYQAFRWARHASERGNIFGDHLLALWLRDNHFRAAASEFDEYRYGDSTLISWANYHLVTAIRNGDDTLLPLAFCLVDSMAQWRQTKDEEKAYGLALLLKQKDLPLTEDAMERQEDRLSFWERWSVEGQVKDGEFTLEPDDLPDTAVEIDACAAATGQAAIWKEAGLFNKALPTKDWTDVY